MLRRCFLALSTAFLIAFLIGGSAHAAPLQPAKLSDAEKADLKKLEEYLNGVTSLQAGFVQVGSQGDILNGTFYLQRPGRMRFQYAPPSKVLLVADGTLLVYYDGEVNQTTNIPLSSTPIGFLAEDQIRFSGAVTVTRFEHENGVFRVTVRQTKEPDQGSLTMTFSEAPLQLVQWVVVDAQNNATKVSLVDQRQNVKLDRQLFYFVDPRFGIPTPQ